MNVSALDDTQREHLQAWTALALERMPYMASMIFSLRVVDAPGLGTFAVDRHHRCYIDFDAVVDKGPDYGAQAMLHECCHLFGDHATIADELGLTGGKHADVMNLAADASINDDLRDAGLPIFADGAGHVTPSTIGEPDYQTVQHYFRALMAKMRPPPPPGGPGQQGQDQGQGAGQSQPGQGTGQPGQGQPQPGQGGGQDKSRTPGQTGAGEETGPFKGCGSGSGGNAAPCELPEGEDLNGAAPAASAAEHDRVLVATAATIAEHVAKGRGTVPGGLVERANLVLAPSQVPWQRVLGRTIRGAVRSRLGTRDASYSRRNRRRHNERILTPTGPGRRLVIPAITDPTPHLEVVRDTSGSMGSDDLSAVTSEVVAIAKRLRVRGPDLVITDVDAAVHTSAGFTRPSAMNDVAGRGGTDMRVGIEHALSKNPTAVIVMTDGGTPWPTEQTTRIPVIAVVIGEDPESYAQHVPSWIRTVTVTTPARA